MPHGCMAACLATTLQRLTPLLPPSSHPTSVERARLTSPAMAQPTVLVFASQKGGVGKTTVATGIASVLGARAAAKGKRVLMVDLDPQHHATMSLGVRPVEGSTVGDLLRDWCDGSPLNAAASVVETDSAGVSLLPAGTATLARAASDLMREPARLSALSDILATAGSFDAIIVDTPPNLDGLTQTAVATARGRGGVVGVTGATPLEISGVLTLQELQRRILTAMPRSSRWLGVVVNKWDGRRTLSKEMYRELVERKLVPIPIVIPVNVRVAELTDGRARITGFEVDEDGNKVADTSDVFGAIADRLVKR